MGSPLNWIAAFDILLCALSTVNEGSFYIRRHTNVLEPAHDIAYADDLISGMSTRQGLQLKADIVSAFSIIFGLDIATNKLRTFLHFPTGVIPPSSQHQNITIFTTGWTNHSITVSTTGTLKVLGKLYDISSVDIHKTQFEHTLRRVTIGANMISRARGHPHMRRMALRSCIALRAQYTGQFSSWTDKQLKLLDIPFSAAYRKLTSNTFAFPTDLLYLPHKLGGLGLHRTSDGIQAAKNSILQ